MTDGGDGTIGCVIAKESSQPTDAWIVGVDGSSYISALSAG